jgi:hypothetical protein
MPAAALAFLLSLALWSAAAWAAHPRELFDVPLVWTRFYPAAILLSAAFAFAAPGAGAVWRWPAIVFAAFALVLGAQGIALGAGAGLWPLTLVAAAAVALPGFAAAAVAARLRQG